MNLRRNADPDPWLVSDCHLLVLRYEHNTNKAHSLFTNLGSVHKLAGDETSGTGPQAGKPTSLKDSTANSTRGQVAELKLDRLQAAVV